MKLKGVCHKVGTPSTARITTVPRLNARADVTTHDILTVPEILRLALTTRWVDSPDGTTEGGLDRDTITDRPSVRLRSCLSNLTDDLVTEHERAGCEGREVRTPLRRDGCQVRAADTAQVGFYDNPTGRGESRVGQVGKPDARQGAGGETTKVSSETPDKKVTGDTFDVLDSFHSKDEN